jgi:AcrR family transcriptional regulator
MVEADQTSLKPVAEEDNSKRRQILEGARKVFMDLGFDGASMGEIARAAGVSKGTLYVYFADKCRLFEAIVEDELELRQHAFNFDPAHDIATTLRNYGGSAIRTVMGIAERMPEVGRRYYERALEQNINLLTAYLEQHVKTGELAIDDCALAAAQFPLMCQASLFLPWIFQAAPAPSQQRINEVIDSAVRMFLAAYQRK